MQARSKVGAGFTIVETMIFLAISGLMFILAISSMSGKQQQTEFTTGVETLKSDLNADLSNVADGNYLSLDNSGCVASTTSPAPVPATGTYTGSSPDGSCDLIGEIISFNNTTNSSGQNYFDVSPVFGRTFVYQQTGQFVNNLSDAYPQIDADILQNVTMPFSISLDPNPSSTLAIRPTISGTGLGALGVFSFNNSDSNSGSEHDEIAAIPLSSLTSDVNPSTLAGIINGNGTYQSGLYNCMNDNDVCIANATTGHFAPVNPSGGVTFCVSSGTDKESALFTVGGINNPSNATYQVYDSKDCANA